MTLENHNLWWKNYKYIFNLASETLPMAPCTTSKNATIWHKSAVKNADPTFEIKISLFKVYDTWKDHK